MYFVMHETSKFISHMWHEPQPTFWKYLHFAISINKVVFQTNVVHLLKNQLVMNKGSRINYNKLSINFEFDQELKRKPILNIIQT
jgi:hypothetical protein